MNFAIIGINFGRNYFNCLKNIPNCSVPLICSCNEPDDLNKFNHPDWDTLWVNDYKKVCESNSIDTVIIATPPQKRKEIALYALDCDKNLILEKPATLNLDDFYEIRNKVKQTGRSCIVNFIHLWNPKYKELKNRLMGMDYPSFIKIENYGYGPFRSDYSPFFDYFPHSAAMACDLNYNLFPVEDFIQECSMGDNASLYTIYLNFGGNICHITTGNIGEKKKVEVSIRSKEKVEFYEDKREINVLELMLKDFIDQSAQRQYHNLDLAEKVAILMDRLNQEIF